MKVALYELSAEFALKYIKSKILNEINCLIFTDHAELRMQERGIYFSDVVEILLNADKLLDARESETEGYESKTNYRVAGKYGWSVVISFNEPDGLIVVTVID